MTASLHQLSFNCFLSEVAENREFEMEKLLIVSAIIAAFLCIQQVSAQVPGFGRCPRTAAITNFNVQRYLGLWYEIRSYPAIFQAFGACTQAEYSMLPNNTVLVNNTMLQFSRPNNIVGNAQLPEPLVGELIVNFPSTGGPVATTPNYIILGTDYDNYAVVHSCTQIGRLFNFQFAWILSRNRALTTQQELAIAVILRDNGVSRSPFYNTRQMNCAEF